jgi:hypothetical protein
MSAFTYDGPRNVLCTLASMSTDVRIQPTPEPTPIWDLLLPKQSRGASNYYLESRFIGEKGVGV